MIKRAVCIMLLPICCQAQIQEWQGNEWLKEIEKVVVNDFLYDMVTKPDRINFNHKYYSRQKNLWLKAGVYTEHLSKGLKQTRLRKVIFGTESGFRQIMSQEQIPKLRAYTKALPFGMYLGDSFETIDQRLQKISKRLLEERSKNYKILKLRDIPPFVGLDVTFHFLDDKLNAFELSIDPSLAESYQKRLSDIPTLNFITAEQTLAKACTRDEKVSIGLIGVLIGHVIEKGLNAKPHRDFYSTRLVSGSDFTTSYDKFNMNVIWDYNGLDYPEYFFNRLIYSINVSLNKAFKGTLYDKLLIADYKVQKLSDHNFVFYHPQDQYTQRISKHLFHAFWDKKHRKIILRVRYPQKFSSAKPFDPVYIAPQSLNTLSSFIDKSPRSSTNTRRENNASKKNHTDEGILNNVIRLKKELAQFPGNRHLALLGSNVDDFRKIKGLQPRYKKVGDRLIIDRLVFWMGSQSKVYKGKAPYGLTRKMKFEKAIAQFPEINPLTASFDGYRRKIKHSVKLFEELSLQLELIFINEKLSDIIVNVSEPLSREWQLLRDKIFY